MAGCNNGPDKPPEEQRYAPTLTHSIIASYPHDTSSYTQGLMFYKGQLLEGTGLEGKSKLMQVDLQSGKVIRSVSLPAELFGEGITVLNDTLYQLTWTNNKVLVYDAKNFNKIKEFPLNTEGWGITNDGKQLIVTDGSGNLFFYDPVTFRLLRTQGVSEMGQPMYNLNELEYINGFVYANKYGFDQIYKIDPATGDVVAKLDLSALTARIKSQDPHADVLNGIAYHPETDKVYVTGKLWPQLFEIQFEH
jgi:glutamine cyclotransferase